MVADLIIRESTPFDLQAVMEVEREAFGSEENAILVRDLLSDPSAEPRLSLLAILGDQPVGHIIFTQVVFDPPIPVKGAILGPLAVIPAHQKEGVGGRLIETGLDILRSRGVDWVFVLGHASYYPRFGFTSAQKQGFEPPYPFPEIITNPWMALALTPPRISAYRGKVIPSETFDDPQYWGE